MVLGVGSYGQTYTLTDPTNTTIGASTSGPGTAGSYTKNDVGHQKFTETSCQFIVSATNCLTLHIV